MGVANANVTMVWLSPYLALQALLQLAQDDVQRLTHDQRAGNRYLR
jgi:hypothetical protein